MRGKRGRSAWGKVPVIGLLKHGECVFVKPVSSCGRADLLPIIKGKVIGQATIYTDGWHAYEGLLSEGYRLRKGNLVGSMKMAKVFRRIKLMRP